ncbi:Fragile X mental retardation syndrome-related protein 1, partial [Caligus rogercresseyi]
GAGYYSGHVEEGSLSLFLRGTRELASTPGSNPSHASLSPPHPERHNFCIGEEVEPKRVKELRSNVAVLCSSASAGELRASTKWSTRTTFVPDPTCHTSRTRTFIPIWIPLPLETEDIYAEDEDSHAVFVKSINACSVKYEPAKRSLRVVSTDEDTQRKAAMIQGMYFQNFTQKVLLKSKTEEVERHLEATRIQSTYGYTEDHRSQRANIQQARSVGCIIYLELQEETSTFRVTGDNKDCVRKARKLLEFTEDK